MGVMCYLIHRRLTESSSYYVHFTGGEIEAWRSRITTRFTRRVGGDPGCRPCLPATLGDSYMSGSQRAPPSPLLSSLFSYFSFFLKNTCGVHTSQRCMAQVQGPSAARRYKKGSWKLQVGRCVQRSQARLHCLRLLATQ